jgi:hypothetical protein
VYLRLQFDARLKLGCPADLLTNQAVMDTKVQGHTSRSSRDETHVTTDEVCRSGNYATDSS